MIPQAGHRAGQERSNECDTLSQRIRRAGPITSMHFLIVYRRHTIPRYRFARNEASCVRSPGGWMKNSIIDLIDLDKSGTARFIKCMIDASRNRVQRASHLTAVSPSEAGSRTREEPSARLRLRPLHSQLSRQPLGQRRNVYCPMQLAAERSGIISLPTAKVDRRSTRD